jgi:palmitoyltransferase
MSIAGIGQCVGARNHKFFFNFSLATSIFTAYVLSSVAFFFTKSMRPSEGDVDPHFIVLLALAGLFFLFTTTLCVSHVRLITHGQTTVESMQIQDLKDKDEQVLARGFAWWECR